MSLSLGDEIELAFEFGISHLLEVFFQPFKPLLNLAQIADDQVEINSLSVAQGIDLADVRDRWIVEGAQHMSQGVHSAQVGKKSGFLERLLTDRSNVNVLDRGVRQLLGVVLYGQAVQAVVGNLGDPQMGFARVGEGAAGNIRLGEDLEQRCLAYLRQADNAGFHWEHSAISSQHSVCAAASLRLYQGVKRASAHPARADGGGCFCTNYQIPIPSTRD